MTKPPPPEPTYRSPTPAEMAAVRKEFDKALAKRMAYEAEGGPARDLRLLRRRVVAELLQLSSICERRGCRRSRTCRITGAPCLTAHRRETLSRFSVLAGYREPDRTDDGEDEDLAW